MNAAQDLLKLCETDETRADDLAKITAVAEPLLKQFFPEYTDGKIPFPHFKVSAETNPKTLGLCRWSTADPTNTTITVQKTVVDDEATLKRVVVHELIHHWEFMTHPDIGQEVTRRRMGLGSVGHGDTFLRKAEEINNVLGKDFVTVKSDQSYTLTPSTKSFYVLIRPLQTGTDKRYGGFGWASAIRPSKSQRDEMKRQAQSYQAKTFKTSDQRLHGTPIRWYGGVGMSTDKEVQDLLAQMYNQGKPEVVEAKETTGIKKANPATWKYSEFIGFIWLDGTFYPIGDYGAHFSAMEANDWLDNPEVVSLMHDGSMSATFPFEVWDDPLHPAHKTFKTLLRQLDKNFGLPEKWEIGLGDYWYAATKVIHIDPIRYIKYGPKAKKVVGESESDLPFAVTDEDKVIAPWTIKQVWGATPWHDSFQDLYPGFSKPATDDGDYYWQTKAKAVNGAKEMISMFSFPQVADVYRVVHAASKEDVDTENLGNHWTVSDDNAVRVASETIQISRPWFVIHGKVDRKYIDWQITLEQQFTHPDEYEVYVHDDSQVRVVDIQQVGKNESLSKDLTAAQQLIATCDNCLGNSMVRSGTRFDIIEGVWTKRSFSEKPCKFLTTVRNNSSKLGLLEKLLQKSDLKLRRLSLNYLNPSRLQTIPTQTQEKFKSWLETLSNHELEPVSEIETLGQSNAVVCRVRVDDTPWRLEFSAWAYPDHDPLLLEFRKVINKDHDEYSTSVLDESLSSLHTLKSLLEDYQVEAFADYQSDVDFKDIPKSKTSKSNSWATWVLTKPQIAEILSGWDRTAVWTPMTPMTRRSNRGFHPTAIKRAVAPAPIRAYLATVDPKREGLNILYHGVGQDHPGAADLGAMRKNKVTIYDPYHPDVSVTQKPKGGYDEIHSCYTLNVVDKEEGKAIMQELHDLLNDKGLAIVSVRRDLKQGKKVSEARVTQLPKRYQGKVGKSIGGNVYVHRDYAGEVIPQDLLSTASSKPPKDFDYVIIKYNLGDQSLSFIQSHDFDDAQEPTVGDSIKVSGSGETTTRKAPEDPEIYHHKWLMVKDDYQGFDVEASKQRSQEWMQKPGIDYSRIGRKSFWKNFMGEDKSEGVLWHVTLTKNVPKIQKQGIKPQRKPSGTGMLGQDIRKDKNAVYAFSSFGDAIRWSVRMTWNNKDEVSIIEFKRVGEWVRDKHVESTKDWLISKQPVDPSLILKVIPFERDQTKIIDDVIHYKGVAAESKSAALTNLQTALEAFDPLSVDNRCLTRVIDHKAEQFLYFPEAGSKQKRGTCPTCSPGHPYAVYKKEIEFDYSDPDAPPKYKWVCTNCGHGKPVGKTPTPSPEVQKRAISQIRSAVETGGTDKIPMRIRRFDVKPTDANDGSVWVNVEASKGEIGTALDLVTGGMISARVTRAGAIQVVTAWANNPHVGKLNPKKIESQIRGGTVYWV